MSSNLNLKKNCQKFREKVSISAKVTVFHSTALLIAVGTYEVNSVNIYNIFSDSPTVNANIRTLENWIAQKY